MPVRDDAQSERTHRGIERVLRGGLAASAVAMISGLTVCLVTGHTDSTRVSLFDIASAPIDFGVRLLAFGVLILALTPAARVVALVVLWARIRDWRFVFVALLVAAVLVASATLAHG